MIRSKNCVFLSHCIFAQAVRAEGLAKKFPAAISPVVQFCLDNSINMFQMPCPEMQCMAGGLGRKPHGKTWYEKNGLRETAATIASNQVAYMKELTLRDFNILAIIGIEFSPACAPKYLNRGAVIIKDKGIYIEELEKRMEENNLEIPFLGVNTRWHKKLKHDLEAILVNDKQSLKHIEVI